jgi:hypothetical protein
MSGGDFVQGEDPDIETSSNDPEPELGAPGGEDNTVGTTPEGDVNDPEAETDGLPGPSEGRDV